MISSGFSVRYKLIRLSIVTAVVFGCSYIFTSSAAAAVVVDWMSEDPEISLRDDIASDNVTLGDPERSCVPTSVDIASGPTRRADVCVYQADGFRYAILQKRVVSGYSSYLDESFLVAFPSDRKMYRVAGMPVGGYVNYVRMPQSKHIVYRSYVWNSTWGYNLSIIDDFASKLERIVEPDLTISYQLVADSVRPLVKNEEGDPVMMRSVVASPNGKWLAVEMRPGGLLRFDMEKRTFKWFSLYTPSYGLGSDGHIEFAISDDGRHVAVSGQNVESRIADVSGDCGVTGSIFREEWRSVYREVLTRPCKERTLTSSLVTVVPNVTMTSRPSFNMDAGTLTMLVTPYGGAAKWATLTAKGYNPPELDYLALGDSYSSGEGDIGRKPDGSGYYKSFQVSSSNECHVSERSYPFLLAQYFHLDSNKVKSVACSGAKVLPDYVTTPDTYLGQHRQLESFDDQAKAQIRQTALETFSPGVVPQIEFVRKYQPRVVTLTGGGNDVGFSDILHYCAGVDWGLVAAVPCLYAVPGTELRAMLGSSIQQQYYYTRQLILKLHEASPATKVYIVGYPSFIAGKEAVCLLNTGTLDGEERDMINEAVKYMNDILEQAANSTGAMYIDVEDSLTNERLCEGSESVTGVNDIGLHNIATSPSMAAQTFHPNSTGHFRVANKIATNDNFSFLGENSSSYSTLVPLSIPAYFGAGTNKRVSEQYEMTNSDNMAGDSRTVTLPLHSFEPSSDVTVTVFSDPTHLGTYSTDYNGALMADITLPSNLSSGIHVLTVTGKNYSGEEVSYYQFIRINDLSSSLPSVSAQVNNPTTKQTNSIKTTSGDYSPPSDINEDTSKASDIPQQVGLIPNMFDVHRQSTAISAESSEAINLTLLRASIILTFVALAGFVIVRVRKHNAKN